MNSKTWILLVSLAFVFVSPVFAQKTKNRGIKVNTQETPAPALDRSIYDNLWGVVIGINKYRNWDRLEYAVNDARSVKKMLVDKFGFRSDHVIELLDEEATLLNIRTTLGGLLPMKAKKNDGVLIFFAGHGETVDLPDGGNLGYLVPVDGSADKSEYFATLLPMTQVREICNLIPAKHLFFVVDACYSGLAAAADRGMSAETKVFAAKLASLKSREILTAGGRGEPVMEKAEWGHSAFTYKFLEGLESGVADQDGNGIITSFEIATYIKSRVPKISDNKQTPQFKNLTNDEGEFIFISNDRVKQTSSTQSRSVGNNPGREQGGDQLQKENEDLKKQLDQLKKEKKEEAAKPKKEEKKHDEIFTPPP